MKELHNLVIIAVTLMVLLSCKTSAYITDGACAQRQKQMMKDRTGVNFLDGGLLVVSAFIELLTGVKTYPENQGRSYRKVVLLNQSKDTLFINMVTDFFWKDSIYADIREIVMPPLKSTKIIVPMGINYNVYFRNDFYAPDDEMLEINTAQKRRIKLKPRDPKLDVP